MKPGGHIVLKVSRGGSEGTLKKKLEESFRKVQWFKPEASFKDSSEIYLVGIGYKKEKNTQHDIFSYSIVPNTNTEGFDQTLTKALNEDKSVANDATKERDDKIAKENQVDGSIRENMKSEQAEKVLQAKKISGANKKQEKYQINTIFGYKKLV